MIKILFALLLTPIPAFSQAENEKDLTFTQHAYPIVLTVNTAGKVGEVAFETGFSLVPEKDYEIVLLQGMMPDPNMRLDLLARRRTFFLSDTRCEQVGFRRYPNGRFWARYRTPAPGRQPVKFSVVDLGLKGTAELEIYSTELLFQEDLREEAPAAPAAAYTREPGLSVPESAPFTLVRRAAWKAAPPKEPYVRHAPYYFTLHHTQGNYPRSYEAAAAEMRFIQDFHQNGRGWNDIAYHFLIDPQGNIFEGRPVSVTGAHVLNRNTGNIGISIMGNYHPPTKDIFTPAARDSFVAVGSYVKDTYAVDISSFFAHREIGRTDCPGDNLYAQKGLLRDLVFPGPRPAAPGGAFPLPPVQAESLERLKRYLNRE